MRYLLKASLSLHVDLASLCEYKVQIMVNMCLTGIWLQMEPANQVSEVASYLPLELVSMVHKVCSYDAHNTWMIT